MTNQFTVFGGNGFVGGAVSRLLEARGKSVLRVHRGGWPESGSYLGNVIFTIGMTADFRTRLIETVEMQIIRLHEALVRYNFNSFTYLSSTRVYQGAASTREDATLLVRPHEREDLYNISKLAGESLCFAHNSKKIRVVRMSNVYGVQDASNLFLTAVMREAVTTGSVVIRQSPASSKDYIWIDDVAPALIRIAEHGAQRIYNVAAGANVTHQAICDILTEAGYKVVFVDGGVAVTIPPIDIARYTEEFRIAPADPRVSISRVLLELRNAGKSP